MKELLEKLVELAREWSKFSREVNGWDTYQYLNDTVRCYFACGGDHRAVTFNISREDRIQVSFHSTPHIDGFTVRSVDLVAKAIDIYTKSLEDVKGEYEKRNKDDIEREKAGRIDTLKQQLAELEGT